MLCHTFRRFLVEMTSAVRKRELRREANAKKGKTTRSYTWRGGAPKKKALPPKTKKQLKEQYDKDQATIQELSAQIVLLKASMASLPDTSALEEESRTLRESGANVLGEADKWRAKAHKWKLRCQAMEKECKRQKKPRNYSVIEWCPTLACSSVGLAV